MGTTFPATKTTPTKMSMWMHSNSVMTCIWFVYDCIWLVSWLAFEQCHDLHLICVMTCIWLVSWLAFDLCHDLHWIGVMTCIRLVSWMHLIRTCIRTVSWLAFDLCHDLHLIGVTTSCNQVWVIQDTIATCTPCKTVYDVVVTCTLIGVVIRVCRRLRYENGRNTCRNTMQRLSIMWLYYLSPTWQSLLA